MAGALEKPFRLIATPATVHTREVGFAVKVNVSAAWPARLPILGTAYSACTHLSKVRQKEFKNYILTKVEGSGEYFWFYFSKNKTAAEAMVPFKDPDENFGNHYWPQILVKIDITKSRLPRAVNTGDSIYRGSTYTASPTWIPSADTGTLFVLREYLSPTRFTIPHWPTPMTAGVSFPLPGSSPFTFSECLHDDILIGQLQESESIYATVGAAVTSNIGVYQHASFPATNFKTWLPYYLYDRQTQIATGSWHRSQMEVIPPALPRKVSR